MLAALSRVTVIPESWTSKRFEVVAVGLDDAGKTSILHRLLPSKSSESVLPPTTPSIGCDIKTITHGRHSITIWEFGGQEKVRPLWRFYYWNAHAFIFVVDSTLPSRFPEAREALLGMYKARNIKKFPLLVLANKTDLPGSVDLETIKSALGVEELGVVADVMGVSAMTGAGLEEALNWLANHVSHELIASHNEAKKHVERQQ